MNEPVKFKQERNGQENGCLRQGSIKITFSKEQIFRSKSTAAGKKMST